MINKLIKKYRFVNMSNVKIFSQSIVMIEKDFKGQVPINFQGNINQITNPFGDVGSLPYLKGLYKDVFKKEIKPSVAENPLDLAMTKTINFENELVFTIEKFPPKFIIHHNTSDEKTDKIKQIFSNIIRYDDDLIKKVNAIGFNFEFFINENKYEIKDIVCNERTQKDLNAVSISLKYDLDNIAMNLTIADAKQENQDGIYFRVNFHHNINEKEDIDNLLSKDLLKIAKNKINSLLN